MIINIKIDIMGQEAIKNKMPNSNLILSRAIDKKEMIFEDGRVKFVREPKPNLRQAIETEIGPIRLDGTWENSYDIETSKRYIEQRKAKEAKNRINQRYAALGGYSSKLGLPMGEVNADLNGGYQMKFRGGSINDDGNGKVWAETTLRAELWMVGVQCILKQEVIDEVYGSVTTLMPSFGGSSINILPEASYRHDGERISNYRMKMYDGPPADLLITGNLKEKDNSIEIVNYKAKVEEWTTKAIAAFGGATGSAAESMASSNSFISDITDMLFSLISKIFGLDDDPYPPSSINIFAKDMISNNYGHHNRTYKSRSIDFTHSFDLVGFDQGGDQGIYTFFLELKMFNETQRI